MDLDAGTSFNAAPTAIQKLLAKVKARKKAVGETDTNQLSSKLDELIEFAWKVPIKGGGVRIFPRKGVKSIGSSPLGLAVRKRQSEAAEYKSIIRGIQDAGKRMENYKFVSGKLDELIEFQTDPRPRNPLGEFTGQEEGGPDPNAMVKTYRIAPNQPGMAPNKSGPGILGAGGLTVLGGAGGAIGGKLGGAAWDKIGSALKKVRKK